MIFLYNVIAIGMLSLMAFSAATGKLKKIKLLCIIILLAILPFVIGYLSVATIGYFIVSVLKTNVRYVASFIGVLFSNLVTFITYIFMIVHVNFFMKSAVKKDNMVYYRMDQGIKINNIGVYSMVVSVIWATFLLIEGTKASLLLAVLGCLPGAIVLALPMAVIMWSVIAAIIGIMLIISYIFIINGNLRILHALKLPREENLEYLILMLIPILNIISTLMVNNKAYSVRRGYVSDK